MYYIPSFLTLNGDFFFSNNFYFYSNFSYLIFIFSFYLEFFLSIYILYQFSFFNEKKDLKNEYFKYIFFLVFLIFLTFVYLYNINHYTYNIITIHLLSTKYTMYSKLIILFLMCNILLICQKKILIQPIWTSTNELQCLLTFLILFIFILLSSFDFFVIYLSIEGISLVLYTLGSLVNKSLINLEAIIKYFLINNMASSFLLWSISYIYILIGSTDCFELQYYLIYSIESLLTENLYFICFIFIISICFKLALFPFQWWIADIFEGFWTPITLIYAVVIKITFFLFFFKLIWCVFYSIIFLFQPFLLISALGSIIYGSLGALIQIRIKRFLAYTSIAQSGYIIMGLACNSLNGSISALLYLSMYCFVTLSFFCILLNLEHIIKCNNVLFLNQLYSIIVYNKEICFHLILLILVMAAIPPFTSFFAKLLIFIVSIENKLELITALLLTLTLISTFYYLNFIQQLIFLKFKNHKIYIFKENIFNIFFLRLSSLFFCLSFFIIPSIYNFAWNVITSSIWPLCYCI